MKLCSSPFPAQRYQFNEPVVDNSSSPSPALRHYLFDLRRGVAFLYQRTIGRYVGTPFTGALNRNGVMWVPLCVMSDLLGSNITVP